MTSVLQQTYTNWSYTVVDNCSTDGTSELVEAFARKDSRIRHLRFEKFVGANDNHERAVRTMEAESVYCKLVQGDDWLFPECLEHMVNRAESSDSIGVVEANSIRAEWLRRHSVDRIGLPPGTNSARGSDVLRECLLGARYATGAPTATLIRSDLVRRRTPFFDSRYWHCDTEAVYWLLTHSDFGYEHRVLCGGLRDDAPRPRDRDEPEPRSSRADRLNTYWPEEIRFLLRYGPVVLAPDEHEARLRYELNRYAAWHAGFLRRPWRYRDPEFFEFHAAEIESIISESGDDRRVRATMAAVRAALSCGRALHAVRTRFNGADRGAELT